MTTIMAATITIYVNTTVIMIMIMTMAMNMTGTTTMLMTMALTKAIIMTMVATTSITNVYKQVQQDNFYWLLKMIKMATKIQFSLRL